MSKEKIKCKCNKCGKLFLIKIKQKELNMLDQKVEHRLLICPKCKKIYNISFVSKLMSEDNKRIRDLYEKLLASRQEKEQTLEKFNIQQQLIYEIEEIKNQIQKDNNRFQLEWENLRKKRGRI